ncbi:MAG: EamA family transporter [Spirochaetales bacterium]|nr:EamA family transporter [Spirochaetales bacterium]
MTDKNRFWPPVMILVMIIWATFYPIIKYVVVDMDPLVLSFYRYFLGFIPLTPFFISELRKQSQKPKPCEIVSISLLGFIGITLFSVGLFYGIKLSTAINGALLTNTQPIFTAILGPVLIAEALSKKKILGVAVGITGMILVVTNGNFTTFETGGTAVIGNLLLIGASLVLSFYSMLIRKYIKRYGSIIPTWISMVSGTFFILIINIFRDQSPSQLLALPTMSIVLVLYLGIIGTSLTYLIFNKALIHMPVTTATSYKLLIPVFGLFFAVIFLGEQPGTVTLIGIFVVVSSVYIIQKEPKISINM